MMHIWDSTCSVDGEGIGEIKSGGVVQVGFLLAFRETRDEQKRSWSNLWYASCVHDGEVCDCDDSDLYLNRESSYNAVLSVRFTAMARLDVVTPGRDNNFNFHRRWFKLLFQNRSTRLLEGYLVRLPQKLKRRT